MAGRWIGIGRQLMTAQYRPSITKSFQARLTRLGGKSGTNVGGLESEVDYRLHVGGWENVTWTNCCCCCLGTVCGAAGEDNSGSLGKLSTSIAFVPSSASSRTSTPSAKQEVDDLRILNVRPSPWVAIRLISWSLSSHTITDLSMAR